MKTYLISDCQDNSIIEMAQGLEQIGLAEHAKQYYLDDGNGDPFFMIVKKFDKDEDDENDIESENTIYIDVCDEGYRVQTMFGHVHLETLETTLAFTAGIVDGTICDASLVTPQFTTTAYLKTSYSLPLSYDQMVFLAAAIFALTANYMENHQASMIILAGNHMHISIDYPEDLENYITFTREQLPEVVSNLRIADVESPAVNDYRVYARLSFFPNKRFDLCLMQE